jgi:hypothetical protein
MAIIFGQSLEKIPIKTQPNRRFAELTFFCGEKKTFRKTDKKLFSSDEVGAKVGIASQSVGKLSQLFKSADLICVT